MFTLKVRPTSRGCRRVPKKKLAPVTAFVCTAAELYALLSRRFFAYTEISYRSVASFVLKSNSEYPGMTPTGGWLEIVVYIMSVYRQLALRSAVHRPSLPKR